MAERIEGLIAIKEWLIQIAESVIVVIDVMALLVIVVGTFGAFVALSKAVISHGLAIQGRLIWLNYARWLIAGLTFQLAADIIESSIATSWDAVGRLAAVAIIRTFLNYFLERDRDEILEQDGNDLKAHTKRGAAPS